jgi:histidine triad (HIT) family protein
MEHQNCLFCKIIRKEIPAKIIYENEDVLAFKDIHPLAKIHYLFIAKKHTNNLTNLVAVDEGQLSKIFQAINDVCHAEDLQTKGFRVVTNSGEHGGQTVFHTHFHLLGGEPLGGFGVSTR